MQLIIQGDDKRRAKTWIQFAKNKLRQIKTFAPEPILINEIFRPVSDILVHIKSVNGLDTIRIETEGGKYMCDFPVVDRYPIPHSDFLITCPVRPKAADEFLALGFWSRTNDISSDWDVYDWDFGDGEVDTGAVVFHEYDKPGEYTVTLTVSRDIVEYNAPSTEGGGAHGTGVSNYPSDGFAANEALAYSRFSMSGSFSGNFRWHGTAGSSRSYIGMTPTPKKSFSYEGKELSQTFNLTSVAAGSTVTCYIDLLLLDWLEHYPNFEDPGFQIGGVGGAVSSDIGGSATPIIGGQYAPWEPFNMGDLSSFVGQNKTVNITDAGGFAHFSTYITGIPPLGNPNGYSNRVGVIGDNLHAVVEEAGTQLKTTKVIKVYTGRRGHKRSFQVGDSVHT